MSVQDKKLVQDMIDLVVEKYGSVDYAIDSAGLNIDLRPLFPFLPSFLSSSSPFSAGFGRPSAADNHLL
jgi:hypothetical protein